MSTRTIDLRTDGVTLPPATMLEAMRAARLGDDNLRDDPTVHELERLSAELTGQEAALFCPTGTMANLLGTRMHTKPGDGVVLPGEANMHRYGVIAWNSLQPIIVDAENGYPAIRDLTRAIERSRTSDIPPALVVIEMPHNHAGGTVTTPDYLAEVSAVAHGHNLGFYMDGSRIFNAAVATGRPVREFAGKPDMMMFCLSKGLSAPVGSMLCGKRELIMRATRIRFLMGGAMRQAGLLAAGGIYALQNLVDRLAEDHANARLLARAAERWPGITLDHNVEINIVYFEVEHTGLTAAQFCARLAGHGVLADPVDVNRVRFVTHREITAADIQTTISAIDGVLAAAGTSR